MAQVCGGSPYDYFRERIAAALQILRSAAGEWAMGGEEGVEFDAVLALVCRVVLTPLSPEGMPLSLRTCLEQVGSAEGEIRRSARKMAGCSPEGAFVQLTEVLAIARESWRLGDPERPPTERVLHAMAMILYRHRLLRRRPPPRFEE